MRVANAAVMIQGENTGCGCCQCLGTVRTWEKNLGEKPGRKNNKDAAAGNHDDGRQLPSAPGEVVRGGGDQHQDPARDAAGYWRGAFHTTYRAWYTVNLVCSKQSNYG